MSARNVPITRPHFDADEERLVVETLRSGWVTQGPRVAEFEREFAATVSAPEAVAVSSCTAALFLSLHALGIGRGDEVIVPALTFIASANSIVHTGATPVFVDVDSKTYNLDAKAVESAITPQTRAVMVVHQLGLPADLDAIAAVADAHGLRVIEDSACAIGSRYKGRPIGMGGSGGTSASGNLGCFSFHPRKVLVTGEGGMITTDDTALAARLRRLRHQGMSMSDLERDRADQVLTETYPEIGYNFRLSDIQAAVGIAQLRKLEGLLAKRRDIAARYDAAFAKMQGIEPPRVPEYARANYQSYIVRLTGADRAARDTFMNHLRSAGVASRRGLMAVHLEAPYRVASGSRTGSVNASDKGMTFGRVAGPLPISEEADAQTVILPIYPDLAIDDQRYVIDCVRDALTRLVARDAR